MTMIRMQTIPRATIDDLHNVEGKAELIAGRIVRFMATGLGPAMIGMLICDAIRAYSRETGRGLGLPDNAGYIVPELSNGRESFSPDVSYYTGPRPRNFMDFVPGAPDFAVEVRSKNDYGPAAELEMGLKRADYFEAGTLVVWDVDPRAETIAVYRATSPDQPTIFAKSESADAEPAMPGWKLPLSEIFQ